MRVVVTGATGNVGTSVVDALLEEPAVDAVTGLARRAPQVAPREGLTHVSADVVTDDLVPIFSGADAVIHLAWAIQPSRSPRELEAVNVDGSRRVFEAVAAARVPAIVHASSVGVYAPGPADSRLVDESWPTTGIETSSYSRHKVKAEEMLDALEREQSSIRVVRLRPALIFKGEAGSEIRRLFAGPFVPARLLAPGRLPLLPWVSGLTTQAVNCEDVAAAYVAAVTTDAEGAFNVAAEPILSATTLGRALGKRVVELPASVVRPIVAASWRMRLQPTDEGWFDLGIRSPLMSSARARSELGWDPRHSATATFAELLSGIAESAGRDTPPLASDAGGRLRVKEILTGIGKRTGL